MPKKDTLKITIQGNGIYNIFSGVLQHEILDLEGSTYHKLYLPNNAVLLINDFGIRSVMIEKEEALDS